MSFYSLRNAETECCPGRISGEGSRWCPEKVCVEVKKVYDACLQQEQLENVRICILGCLEGPPPYEFVSCRSITTRGSVCDLEIERLPERENFARVRGTVIIPIEVVYLDDNGVEHVGKSCIKIIKDVILYVPDESIVPFGIECMASAICVTGTHVERNIFDITVCITVILKIVAKVDLLIPAFGFCSIPPCEQFAENVCDEFFGLPLFPPQLEDALSDENNSRC